MVQAPLGIKISQGFKKSFKKKKTFFSLIVRVTNTFCRILKSLDKNKKKKITHRIQSRGNY